MKANRFQLSESDFVFCAQFSFFVCFKANKRALFFLCSILSILLILLCNQFIEVRDRLAQKDVDRPIVVVYISAGRDVRNSHIIVDIDLFFMLASLELGHLTFVFEFLVQFDLKHLSVSEHFVQGFLLLSVVEIECGILLDICFESFLNFGFVESSARGGFCLRPVVVARDSWVL